MKRINFLNGLIALVVMGLLLSCSRQKPSKTQQFNPEFVNYISAYTSGVISAKSNVKVRLQHPIELQGMQAGDLLEMDLFEFEPKIKGNTYLEDDHTVWFEPIEPLKSQQTYHARFALSKLFDVDKDLAWFDFQFTILGQSFQVIKTGFKPYKDNDLRSYYIEGFLATADYMAQENVEKLLKAEQGKKELPIQWKFGDQTKKFDFIVDSVSRSEEVVPVVITWDGDPLKISEYGTDTTKIPALGDFTVINVSVVQQPEQCIFIQFSDPLYETQFLDGIIRLDGGINLKYKIESNTIKAYPASRISGSEFIRISTGVRNLLGYNMNEPYFIELSFEDIKPEVRLIGKGVILPGSEGLIFPFEAVNLSAVDLRIIKIYEANIPQFLQVNQLDGNNEIKRVGRPVLRKKVQLNVNPSLDAGKWNAYSIDLAKLIREDPGALFQVELSFRQDYSLFVCGEEKNKEDEMNPPAEFSLGDEDWDGSGYYYNDYYYPEGYDWRERDNPCHISYYNSNRWVSRNVLASNLGIIAKGSNGDLLRVAVTDLRTTEPLNGIIVALYNYQHQKIGETVTGSDGFASIDMTKKPWYLVARNGNESGYLRLDDGSSLSVSMFDVSGRVVQEGIKGFLYGERGVWRPGDTLFLNFILEDQKNILPREHPVIFELNNPQGQLVKRLVKTKGLNGFYNFTTTTTDDAPTGLWSANVNVGPSRFYKTIRIETVKPNRLKLNLDYQQDILSRNKRDKAGKLTVKWLHGALAKNLKARIMVTLNRMTTKFKDFQDYVFDDDTKAFYPEEITLFDGTLNEQGEASIRADLGTQNQAPGMLSANFMVRAFEEGGDYSTDFFTMDYAPYPVFVGVKLPQSGTWGQEFVTDSTYVVDIVTIDEYGKPVSVPKLDVAIYKLSWRWWWDVSERNTGNYIYADYRDVISTSSIKTNNEGRGFAVVKIEYPNWGRFLVKVSDPVGGHSASQVFYADWPEWVSRDNRQQPEGAKVMNFTSDKETYHVGEKATVTFPTAGHGRALVSIEDGSDILDAYWITPQKESKETSFSFDIKPEMSPNVYVYITYIQPHAQTANDLPIRLYGILPVSVEDPQTKLLPVVQMPDELAPEKEFTIKVSEKNNRPMTYTLAVVDDGLLDLTRFKTPDPWSDFYAREALGVKTWDMYDYVLGAYGGKLEQLFAIGGDGSELKKTEAKANRFNPVVMFLGPFELKKGKQEHTLVMPQYVGSVRTMVIAGQDGAYGFTEKTTPVKNPLMLLGTLPRVLGPGETVKLPVTVFAMDQKVKKVQVELQTNEMLIPDGVKSLFLDFDKPGEEVVYFDLKVTEKTGIGKVSIVAKSGNEKATYDIDIQVRNPNPPVTMFYETIIQPGESWKQEYFPVGMEGTNSGLLEIANVPSIDFGKRLKYLVGYPYGCAEQTTSAAFPQLYLGDVMELDPRMKVQITKNIKEAVQRLYFMQHSSGGFRYWPSAAEANDWTSSYAGHFMLEAEAKGFELPAGFKGRWIKYQKEAAKNWVYYQEGYPGYYYYYHLQQAYRLYTLALAGEPDLSSMNRLREQKGLSALAQWRLAAAYALAGKPEVARELTRELDLEVDNDDKMNVTFGSSTRDRAMIIETLVIMNEKDKATPLVIKLSREISSNSWYSTQTTAYALIALTKFAGKNLTGEEMDFDYSIPGVQSSNKRTKLPFFRQDIEIIKAVPGQVEVTNKGKSILYVKLMLEGTPLAGAETSENNKLKIKVNYTTLSGIKLDPAKIAQGTDFLAEVEVINPGVHGTYSNMALSQIFPSGWEIINTRLADFSTAYEKNIPDYLDIRDDRVYTHFGVGGNHSKNFVVMLNAAYQGRFYLPAVSCEAMYDNSIYAREVGMWVEVVKPGEE
ncbi:MAG: hypothetical protein JW731_02965 [Bacteroidales bacterium]|nr:hypothetical protein [Bacteroidales bacterium]